MIHNFKSWQGWLLFGASMAVVFCLGLAVSALSERRAEVASIFNNRKNPMKGIVAQNEKFQGDFPREYQTWTLGRLCLFKRLCHSSWPHACH